MLDNWKISLECASVMTPFSLFLLPRKGDKIEVCLAICHRRF